MSLVSKTVAFIWRVSGACTSYAYVFRHFVILLNECWWLFHWKCRKDLSKNHPAFYLDVYHTHLRTHTHTHLHILYNKISNLDGIFCVDKMCVPILLWCVILCLFQNTESFNWFWLFLSIFLTMKTRSIYAYWKNILYMIEPKQWASVLNGVARGISVFSTTQSIFDL